MVVMKGLTYPMIGIAINYIIRSCFTPEVYKLHQCAMPLEGREKVASPPATDCCRSQTLTLSRCCFNVVPTSKTAGQHYNNIMSMPRVCWVAVAADQQTRVIDTMLA